MTTHRRPHVVRSALRVSAVSVAWAGVVGSSAIIAGATSHSIALVGFGLESVIDGLASAVLLWRFAAERRPDDRAELLERAAHRIIGAVLVIVAAYVAVVAINSLLGTTAPARSIPALLLAAAAVAVLPFLCIRKLQLARRLESRALRADGVLTGAGAVLAAAVLLGLVANAAFGWWWADPVAAVVIAVVLGIEGIRTLFAAE